MKNVSLKLLSLSVFTASLISNVAFADKHTVGVITVKEQAVMSFEQLAEKYDANKDNTLSIKELAGSKKWKDVFEQVDTDANKVISKEEFAQYTNALRHSVS